MAVSTSAQAGLQLVALIILARLLTPKDFGVVAAALVVIGFTTIFSQLGVGPAVVQRKNIEVRHLRTAFTLSIIFGASLMGLLWLSAPMLSSFFRMPELTHVVQVLSTVFMLQGISVVSESLLHRELRFRTLAIAEVIAFAIGFGMVGIVLAVFDFGIWALVGANLGQAATKMAILLVSQPHPKKLLIERQAFNELMYFGGGFTLARIGNYLAGHGDDLVVGRCLGAEALGIYGRAHQLMVVPANLFGQVFDKVLFPVMARFQHRPERLGVAFRRGISLIGIVVLPLSAALFLLAQELVYVLLGSQWDEAVRPFQIFALSMLFRTSYKMSDSLCRATGAVYERAWRQGAYASLTIGGAYIGQLWGITGVAWGTFFAVTMNFLLMGQLSLRLVEGVTWRSFILAHAPPAALALVVALEVGLLAPLLRELGSSALAVIAASAACMTLTMIILIKCVPRLFLGSDGVWMLQALTEFVRGRARRLEQ